MTVAERWVRRKGEVVVHADTEEHVSLVLRTLGVDAEAWSTTLDAYAASIRVDASVQERLQTLREVFSQTSSVPSPLPDLPAARCACCGRLEVVPRVARAVAGATPLVYGQCKACLHGQLLSASPGNVHGNPEYYQCRSVDGSGYARYAQERAYREAKGEQLIERLLREGFPLASVLEVGSGFGFTLQAARRRGLSVGAVDVNPEAARAASELYGLHTWVGTLAEAIQAEHVAPGSWDAIVYQFVLEHLDDPREELRLAARCLAPSGTLLLLVPNMACFELEVFGGRYRSLRADHAHLFSAASLRLLLTEAGFGRITIESRCNLDLLRGFLDAKQLEALYAEGRGPDLLVLARKVP